MYKRRSINLKLMVFLIIGTLIFINNPSHVIGKTANSNVVIDGKVSPGEYENSLYLDSLKQYKLSYTIDNGTIYFGFEVNTLGWIGLGLDPTNVSSTPPHAGADIYQGGYSGGTYCVDEYADSSADILTDPTQNILQAQASQNSSWTTLEFSRYLNTHDSHDKIITPDGGMQVIWSFKSTDAIQDHHDHQGSAYVIFYNDTFIPPVLPDPSSNTSASATFNVKIDGTVNSGEYPYSYYMDSLYQYKLSYALYNGTGYYALQVKTLGWVAIGFKTTSPAVDKHLGADMILGAYFDNNGSTGYKDDYGNSQTTHVPDTSLGGTNNIIEAKASQNSTTTTFEFSKPLNTGDQYDQVITPGQPIYVMWSYNLNTDDMITQHTAMGFQYLTLREFTGSTSAADANAPTFPFSPQSLTGNYENKVVNLNWSAPNNDGNSQITRYNVYRKLTTESNYTIIGNSSSHNFSDSSVVNNEAYNYYVTAVNSVGESGSSNVVYVRISQPISLTSINNGAGITNESSSNNTLLDLPIGLSWALSLPAMYVSMFVVLAVAVKVKN